MRIPALCALAALLLAACGAEPPARPGAGHDADTIARNNRGVGLMGRFEYDAAWREFDALASTHPQDRVLRLNRAIARKNRQLEGDEAAALAELQALVDEAADDLRARYCTGLLRYRAGEIEAAVDHLGAVHAADPKDAFAAYFFGQALQQAGRQDEAADAYRKALAADPYLRSAYYALGLIERRRGDSQAAQAALADYQRLGSNPRAQLAEFKYTRMGEKCEAVALGEPASPPPRPSGPLLQAARDTGLRLNPVDGLAPTLLTVDLDGDGRLDLFASGASADGSGGNAVLLGEAEGGFRLDAAHPLAAVAGVTAAAFADFDNDGLIDAYLARRGPNQLWRQRAPGAWEDITEAAGVAAGDRDSRDALWLDADHDGDLDLLLSQADAPDELLNNNLDGSFRSLGEAVGLAAGGAGGGRLLPLDFDNDRDLDLVALRAQPPHRVLRNDRTWSYAEFAPLAALAAQPVVAALAAERAADGQTALYTLAPDGGFARWLPSADGDWRPSAMGQLPAGTPLKLAWLDLDGDGAPELLHADAQRLRVLRADLDALGEVLFEHDFGPAGLAALTHASQDDAQGPHLHALDGEGRLWHFAPGPGRWPFLRLTLSGADSAADGMRSNRSGIGTRLALRSGARWSALTQLRSDAGPGHGLQPLSVGLGEAAKLDFVRLTWTDGVMQTELDLAPGSTHALVETQRQLSSCPVLFAWNGERFGFVSDVLGVGGIGFLLEPGRYAEPRPWEQFLLPEGSAAARAGRFEFRLGEPMEEVAYLDEVTLEAIDLPAGWDLALDERMGTGGEPPTGAPLFFREARLPQRATMNGIDVRAELAEADLRAAPTGPRDRRFLGRLAAPDVLELEFAEALDAGPGRPLLVAEGWVEYPYSQTVFAAWQAQARYEPPSLWARGADGDWRLLVAQFGYPAGMPRQMAFPLPDLPEGTRALRLVGNLEIYWDRLRIAFAEPLDAPRHRLALDAAEVAAAGFARRQDGPQRQPHYDYDQRPALWDTRHLDGYYTAFGPATELVAAADGALAIIGPGEELRYAFRAAAPALPEGWNRRLVLGFRGWAKDMDLYTGDGGRVAPLPGTRDAAAEALHARYNTRHAQGW